jgi:hypothetical protein
MLISKKLAEITLKIAMTNRLTDRNGKKIQVLLVIYSNDRVFSVGRHNF